MLFFALSVLTVGVSLAADIDKGTGVGAETGADGPRSDLGVAMSLACVCWLSGDGLTGIVIVGVAVGDVASA